MTRIFLAVTVDFRSIVGTTLSSGTTNMARGGEGAGGWKALLGWPQSYIINLGIYVYKYIDSRLC